MVWRHVGGKRFLRERDGIAVRAGKGKVRVFLVVDDQFCQSGIFAARVARDNTFAGTGPIVRYHFLDTILISSQSASTRLAVNMPRAFDASKQVLTSSRSIRTLRFFKPMLIQQVTSIPVLCV